MLFLVVAGVRVLVDAREKLHIPWGDPANQSNGDKVMAFDTRAVTVAQGMVETGVFLDYLPAIRALWADSGIQHAYDRRREFQLVRFGLRCLELPACDSVPALLLRETPSEPLPWALLSG